MKHISPDSVNLDRDTVIMDKKNNKSYQKDITVYNGRVNTP